jgi:hypothetical protein
MTLPVMVIDVGGITIGFSFLCKPSRQDFFLARQKNSLTGRLVFLFSAPRPLRVQVYAYLVSCAGKKGECWPNTNTIAQALGMSQNMVISKIDSLVRRQLIGNGRPS